MKNQYHKSALFCVTAIAASVAATSVSAANDRPMLEEIIITAEKREASVQDTSLAITAMGSDQLKDLNIVTQQDIANFTPNMSYQESSGGGEGNRIYIRGVGR